MSVRFVSCLLIFCENIEIKKVNRLFRYLENDVFELGVTMLIDVQTYIRIDIYT